MDQKSDELAAVIAEIRDRVRGRGANGAPQGELPLPDVMPLLHARDAADAKVASIGMVNPRPPGLANNLIQWVKRQVGRALDWHVREQVEFNRAVMNCVQSTIETFNDTKRSISALAGRIDALEGALTARIDVMGQAGSQLRDEAQQLKDIRTHWVEWRNGWEQRLANNEIHFLRSVSELQQSFNYRVSLMDQNYREQLKSQHADYERALERSAEDIQKRLWGDLEKIQQRSWEDLARLRSEYDAIIHAELRVLRQKMSFAKTAQEIAPSAAPEFRGVDWLRFAERFRGSEEAILERQRMYARRFHGAQNVLDIGCGRGEMLQVFREAGIVARGIDLHDESVALCRSRGLEAEQADLFAYLAGLPDSSLGGVVCSQVVEHLPPERLPEMVRLAHAKLRSGALFAIETPNPECLAIFATHFYIDPTHRHPIPPALASFYLEEAGFARIEVERLYPAVDAMPSLAELPESFRREFFGGLDYVICGTKS